MAAKSDPVIVGVALRDDDVAPLDLGIALAALTAAPLVLVHAHPFQPPISVPPPRWEEEARSELHAHLERVAEPLRRRLDVSVKVKAAPSPVRGLHEAAEELGAALLVAGATRRAGVGLVAPGGVGERLLHAAPCAVAIAPREYATTPRGLRRIGVAFIDGPEGRDALAVAAGIARRAGGMVTTYSVIQPSAAGRAEAVVDRVRSLVPAELLEAAEVLDGDAGDALAKVSAGLDLLICGSRGYGPVRSTLVGGVSSRLAHAAACPLLVIPRAPVPGIATLTGRGTG